MSRSKSPTVEEVEDVDIRRRGNLPPKNPSHILELADEAENNSLLPRKKFTGPSTSTQPRTQRSQENVEDTSIEEDTNPQHKTLLSKNRKKIKARPTIIESSDDSNSESDLDLVSKKKSQGDSDIEEIENPKETPEEELGKLTRQSIYKFIITYLFYF